MQLEENVMDALIVILTVPLIIVACGIFVLWWKKHLKKRRRHRHRHY
jgi:membrane protein DedA with SNARE-associated domain